MADRWQIPPDCSFTLRHWSDQSVLFLPQTGDLHLLQRWAAELVEALAAPQTTESLCQHLTRQGYDSTHLHPQVVSTLEALESLAIVERWDADS